MSSSPSAPPTTSATSIVDRINLAIHLRRYVKLVLRRWWILGLCIIGGTGYSFWKAHTLPDIFRARSALAAKPRVQPIVPRGGVVVEDETANDYAAQQVQIMESSKVQHSVESSVAAVYKVPHTSLSVKATSLGGSTFVMTVDCDDRNYAILFA